MNFNESFILNTYSDKANKQFNDMQSRLSEIETNFQMRMNGKTMRSLIGSFIGTIAWLAIFIIFSIIVRNAVEEILLLFSLITSLCLVVFMLIENIMNFSYYKKINTYRNSLFQLQNRISIGKSLIKSNYMDFMNSKAKGWNYLLNPSSSIIEEATLIETAMANMESLKTGFINGAKNVFFYTVVVAFTISTCVALFPVGSQIICGISDKSFSSDTLMTMNIIALFIVGIGEVILARLVWSKTNCTVTNETLLVIALGPIAFLTLIGIVTAIIKLILGLLSFALIIIGIIVVIAIVFGFLSGG